MCVCVKMSIYIYIYIFYICHVCRLFGCFSPVKLASTFVFRQSHHYPFGIITVYNKRIEHLAPFFRAIAIGINFPRIPSGKVT